MTRTRLIAAVAAAAVLTLAGCSSSNSGTPEGAASSTGAAAEATGAGDSSDTADQTTQQDATEDAESSTDGDVVPADLDPQSAAWFNEFCGISDPFNGFFSAMMGSATIGLSGDQVDPAKLVEARSTLAAAFEALGNSMVSVGSKLAGMAPPAIDNGAELAQQVVKGMAAVGPAMGAVAEQVSQISTDDAETFGTELDAAMDSMGDMQEELGIDDLKIDDSVEAAVAALPNCQGSLLFAGSF